MPAFIRPDGTLSNTQGFVPVSGDMLKHDDSIVLDKNNKVVVEKGHVELVFKKNRDNVWHY